MKIMSTVIFIITTKKPHNKVASYYRKKKSVWEYFLSFEIYKREGKGPKQDSEKGQGEKINRPSATATSPWDGKKLRYFNKTIPWKEFTTGKPYALCGVLNNYEIIQAHMKYFNSGIILYS